MDHSPDYELDDVLVVDDPKRWRALADGTRARIIALLRERAASTTELAAALEIPKGTVGHHLKALEDAGLVKVVRTRQVRALTEKFYGRVARLFVMKSDETFPDDLRGGGIAALMLRQASDEVLAAGSEEGASGLLNVRLGEADRKRFEKRLNRLVADLQRADDPAGDRHAFAYALFQARPGLPQGDDDA